MSMSEAKRDGEGKTVVLVSQDDKTFNVDLKVARMSELVKMMTDEGKCWHP